MGLKEKILRKGSEFKKTLDDDKTIKYDSKQIRERYHRIRISEFGDSFGEKTNLFKPIFIVGVPHSGTSVLVSTFRIHTDLANWTEAPEVWEPYWTEGQDSEYNRLEPKYETDVEEIDILRIRDAFSRFVKTENKNRILNKNPRNTVRIEFIKKVFPDAKIIHIFRDGRDVVNSITRNMPSFMIETICDRWSNSLKEVKNQSAKIPKEDFIEIKYEEFCEKPREIIMNAYDKCELKYDDILISKVPEKLHNFNGKWKTEMKKEHWNLLRIGHPQYDSVIP